MKEHSLKTMPAYWDAIANGEKRFEVRRDDRGFQRGDVLLLRKLREGRYTEFEREGGNYTGIPEHARTIRATVDWVMTGGQLGVEPGYVVMSITPQSA